MKRLLTFLMIFSILALTGCEFSVEKIFFPGEQTSELYYNTYEDVKNRIKKEDIRRGNYYDDLFLSSEITSGMDISEVLKSEKRDSALDIGTASEVFFVPTASGGTALAEWINQSKLYYTFDEDEDIVSSYKVINTKTNNSYIEYLYIMRALDIKYGECTTEIYKNEDNIINTEQVKKDYKETDKVIKFYQSEFENGNLEIISQWVMDEYIITVDFSATRPCGVTYEFIYTEETPEDEE